MNDTPKSIVPDMIAIHNPRDAPDDCFIGGGSGGK